LAAAVVVRVSSSSITAKSADGYSTTYAINSSTAVNNGNNQISDVKTGDTVTVVGTVSGSTATATTITDTTLNQANGNQQNGGQNGQLPPGQQNGQQNGQQPNGTTTS